jgi:tetratricopeptide (TPR) repeat protein
MKGDANNAIEHSQNALRYGEDTQMVSILGLAYTLLGFGYALQGDMETGLKNMEKGLEIELDWGVSFSLPGTYVNMSWVYSELGDLNHARNCAEKALELAQKEHFRQIEAWSLVRLGKVIGKIDKSEFNVAEDYILRGMKILDEFKTRPYYAHGNFFLGELYLDAGQTGKAIDYIEEALAMYQEMGMDYWLRRTQSALTKLQGR